MTGTAPEPAELVEDVQPFPWLTIAGYALAGALIGLAVAKLIERAATPCNCHDEAHAQGTPEAATPAGQWRDLEHLEHHEPVEQIADTVAAVNGAGV